MYNIRKIHDDLVYLGVADHNLDQFERMLPTPNGMTYNSYLMLDKETVLFDTADNAVDNQFFENVKAALEGRNLNYLVVHHAEPDHCALIESVMIRYPECKVITSAKCATFLTQFGVNLESRNIVVKEGDTLNIGRHTLTWVMAPMVHWPEVMVTYDTTDHTLFSADAFGSFGSVNGNIFDDEVNYERDWIEDARRYYLNIVGKYGVQVQNVLKKVAILDVKTICPLHGVVWRKNLGYFIDKYNIWSSYQPEENGVCIIYGSMYGNTESAVANLSMRLAERGVKGIQVMNVSRKHFSDCLTAAFRWSHIVFACPTYNNGIYLPMETLLIDLKEHFWQNRTVAIIDNGSWAPSCGKAMTEYLKQMKNITFIDQELHLKSSMHESQIAEMEALADKIVASLK